jgi:hypothetical protein
MKPRLMILNKSFPVRTCLYFPYFYNYLLTVYFSNVDLNESSEVDSDEEGENLSDANIREDGANQIDAATFRQSVGSSRLTDSTVCAPVAIPSTQTGSDSAGQSAGTFYQSAGTSGQSAGLPRQTDSTASDPVAIPSTQTGSSTSSQSTGLPGQTDSTASDLSAIPSTQTGSGSSSQSTGLPRQTDSTASDPSTFSSTQIGSGASSQSAGLPRLTGSTASKPSAIPSTQTGSSTSCQSASTSGKSAGPPRQTGSTASDPGAIPSIQTGSDTSGQSGSIAGSEGGSGANSSHMDVNYEATRDVHNALVEKVRSNTAKARDQMAARYNTSRNVEVFNVGDMVALAIPSALCNTFSPKRIYCKVIRKPQPNTHELRCRHGIIDFKYPTRDLERLPSSITFDIPEDGPTQKISLAHAVKLSSSSNPQAVSCQ